MVKFVLPKCMFIYAHRPDGSAFTSKVLRTMPHTFYWNAEDRATWGEEIRNEVHQWCADQFGAMATFHEESPARWWHGVGMIAFRDARDATAFKVRWL